MGSGYLTLPTASRSTRRLAAAHDAGILVLQRAHHRRQVILGLLGDLLLGVLFLDFTVVHRELDGVGGRARAQVVHARLQALLPAVKVHASQLAKVGLANVNVQRLWGK